MEPRAPPRLHIVFPIRDVARHDIASLFYFCRQEVDGNANRGPMCQVKSAAPYLHIGFKGTLLLRVRPVGSAAR